MDRRKFIKASVLSGIALSAPVSALANSAKNAQSPTSSTNPTTPTSPTNANAKAPQLTPTFDTIFKNGDIFDGSGRASFRGDIAVKDGKIAAMGTDLGTSAGRVIDLDGLTLCPGFIDIHSHTDTTLFKIPKGDSRIFQGITSEVGGNCGGAPFVYSDAEWAKKKGTTRYGHPSWRNVDGFYDALQSSGIGINYCSLVGHGDLRRAVVGTYKVAATDAQLNKMCEMLDEQLKLGAIGLSFGLEYTPGCYCDTREMVALCKVVAKHDALYAIHMRNEDDHVLEAMDEAIEAARQSGARLQISHLKAQNPANFDKLDQMLAKVDAALAEGIDIAFDRYPYTAFYNGMSAFIPQNLRQGSQKEILARLDDPKSCEIIRRNVYNKFDAYGGADKVLVCTCSHPDNKRYSGKSIAACSLMSGLDEFEFIRYLLKSEKLGVNRATFAMSEENLCKLYAHHLSMPGSDGGVRTPSKGSFPHPRYYGTFPRFFEKYVREKPVLSLATAIQKATSLPASRLHINGRGLLIPGYQADITVFNPATIADRATFADPNQFPAGIEHVMVNGKLCVEKGAHTGNLPGEIIRHA